MESSRSIARGAPRGTSKKSRLRMKRCPQLRHHASDEVQLIVQEKDCLNGVASTGADAGKDDYESCEKSW